jgi:hypothetical protein
MREIKKTIKKMKNRGVENGGNSTSSGSGEIFQSVEAIHFIDDARDDESTLYSGSAITGESPTTTSSSTA